MLANTPAYRPGELTYLLQQEIVKYLTNMGLSYQTLAEVLGSMEGLRADFVDRVLLPYERAKRLQNGDVWPDALITPSA